MSYQRAISVSQDPLFHDATRQHLEPAAYRKRSGVFRFMDLPAELRVMIAEYALSFDKGLEWHWTKGPTGKLIGKFRFPKDSVEHHADLDRVNQLSLSRHLHQETAGIWLKVNELRFDCSKGDEVYDPIHISLAFPYAVRDFAFFMKYTEPPILRGLSVCIIGVGIVDRRLHTLNLLTQYNESARLQIRVIESDWLMYGPQKWYVQDFMVESQRMERFFSRQQRNWRVFPKPPTEDEMRALKKYLSDAQYQLALGYVNNGV
jgi:hypothetical protein